VLNKRWRIGEFTREINNVKNDKAAQKINMFISVNLAISGAAQGY
jgi:hypothetical protein